MFKPFVKPEHEHANMWLGVDVRPGDAPVFRRRRSLTIEELDKIPQTTIKETMARVQACREYKELNGAFLESEKAAIRMRKKRSKSTPLSMHQIGAAMSSPPPLDNCWRR